MRLILVRHGQTAHNQDRLTLGRFDVPLNRKGLLQAQAVAASFTRAPDAIYSSPLGRALDTAQMIARATRRPVAVERDLVEMDVGEMEHLTRTELRERYPEFLKAWVSRESADARMPGGETLREVQDRAWRAVERMRIAHPKGVVVAVSHNFVALTLICKALELPLGSFRRVRKTLAAKTILEVGDEGAALLQMNDTAHLLAAGLGDDFTVGEATG